MFANPKRKSPAIYQKPMGPEDLSTSEEIHVARDFPLPKSLVTQTIGVVAQRGAGKTYFTAVLVEEIVRVGFSVCVIDPMGVYWGLLSSADGESEGIPIVVLGGDRGHVQITPQSGRAVAVWLAVEGRPCVLDISQFRKGEQRTFMTDFAEELYQQKGHHKEPLHLVLDEADLWAPQRPRPDQHRLLGAVEDLVRRGRSRGIGLTLVTQRPAVIAKDVLTQVSALVALRITGPQDRKAVEDWIKYHGDEEQKERVLESLGTLPIGTAWFWSPGWLQVLKKIKVNKRRTFDSSSTPEPGVEVREPRALATVDFAALAERFAPEAPPVEPEPAKSPGSRVPGPVRSLRQDPGPRTQDSPPQDLPPALAHAIAERLGAVIAVLQTTKDGILSDAAPFMAGPAELVTPPGDRVASGERRAASLERRAQSSNLVPRTTRGERNILTVLAQHGPCSRSKIALLCAYASTSGSYSNRLSSLRVKGWMIGSGDGPYELTLAGRSQVSVEPLPPVGRARWTWWLAWLQKMDAAILNELAIAGEPLSYAAIAARCGYRASGSFANALSRLRVLGLAEGSRKAFRVTTEVIDG